MRILEMKRWGEFLLMSVVLGMLVTEDMSTKMIDQTTTDLLIVDSIYEDMLKSIIVKEVKFQVQLEKDAQVML